MGVPFITGAALILAPDLKNADMAFVTAVNGLLPPFLAGFTGAAILAAIMSSTDAMLLACSAVVAHDIYAKLINPQADTKFVVRLGSIVVWIVAIIVILLAFNPPALLSVMVAQVIGVLASTFFPVLTLGVWWDRTSKAGAWTGLVVGLVVYVGLKFLFHMPLLTELFIALPLSFAVTIVVSLFTPKVSDETLQRTCYGIHL